MRLAYQRDTSLSVGEFREALLYALDHQETVQMAPGWTHVPHVVKGRVDETGIFLYHASMADFSTAFFHASIVSSAGGSSIVGEFSLSRVDAAVMSFGRWFITLLLFGMPAFVVIGIMRDDQASFSPGLVVFLVVLVLAAILLQPLLLRLARISDDDTKVVRDFIERAIGLARPVGLGA
jgi:hypothetical protein